jgi:hypothetical protein
MIGVLQEIFEKTLARLAQHLTTYLPPLIVAAAILLTAFLIATLVRWLIARAVKGIALDRFLHDSGLSSLVDRSGHLRAASIVAVTVYWLILAVGFLTALDVFDTNLTTRIVESVVFSVPKLVTAGVIILAGFWLGQYLSRSLLVWAVNEGIPVARRLSLLLKVAIVFVAIVVAADTLDFAERVFLAAFIIFVGSAALAVSLAIGFGFRDAVQRFLSKRSEESYGEREKSLWNHL